MKQITKEFALNFARTWIQGANARDFEGVLALYSDEVEASSPYVRMIMNEPTGRLVSKSRLREYWTATLTKRAELKFELLDVFAGADSVAIHYVNRGQRALEVFYFNDAGLICRSDAHYLEQA